MASTFDIIVVGGGAIGAACARELALAGRQVLVVEPGTEIGQAWRAAAGMLAPQIEADGTDPLLELGLAARDHYDHLVPELLETTGTDVGLWHEGIARVATEEPEAAALREKVRWQRRQGYETEWLDRNDVKGRWPWVGPAVGALWASRDGAIDPGQLVAALLADAKRLGTTILRDSATAILTGAAGVEGVATKTDRYSAPDVVVAAGAWSALIQGMPRMLPVQPVRGQMAAVPWPEGMQRAILYHRDCYVMTRGREAVLGSTMEHAGFHSEVTPAGLAHILAGTMALCPGLIRAKVRRSWAGLRPLTPDGLPIIGKEPSLKGLWYATGHGRNGIMLAGLTGLIMAQLIGGATPTQNLRPFAPERFDISRAS